MPEDAYDVVIVGSGAAGLSCAVAAAELGLSCIVLEKAEKFGGGTAISAGSLWVGANHLNAAAGGSDSIEEVTAYLRYVGADGLDMERMHAFASHAPRALEFFESCGLAVQLTPRIDHYHGVAPGAKSGGRIVEVPPISGSKLGQYQSLLALPAGRLFRLDGSEVIRLGGVNSQAAWDAATQPGREQQDLRGAGAGLVAWLFTLAAERGVAFKAGVPVERLITEDGRVTGIATSGGEVIAAHRGVVLACGGYESSPKLVANFEALPGWQSMFPETITGDGLIMATEIGAAVRVIGNNLGVFLGFRNPDDAPDGTPVCRLSGTQELAARHTMVVNRAGRRFTDETFFQAITPSLRQFDVRRREQPNLPCFLVFDEQYARTHSFGGRPPGAAIPGWVERGETIAALAAALHIDADGLTTTIHRFNEDVRQGADTEFHRGETPWGLTRFSPATTLGTIERPPFHGIELHPTAMASAGIDADQRARVLHVRGRTIPGLYAIGNAAARTETGSGYQTGFSLASAMTFGMIAARDMAQTN